MPWQRFHGELLAGQLIYRESGFPDQSRPVFSTATPMRWRICAVWLRRRKQPAIRSAG